jgi:hypothetical protein
MADQATAEAIRRQLYNYCRAVDRLDAPLGRAVWHDDGTADYGPMFKGSGHGFIDWVIEQHRGLEGHSHQISNILSEVDGYTASSEAYVTASLRARNAGKLLQIDVRGRYLDRWEKRDGRWAVAARRYVHDFDDVREVAMSQSVGWGRRDRDDPSYHLAGF